MPSTRRGWFAHLRAKFASAPVGGRVSPGVGRGMVGHSASKGVDASGRVVVECMDERLPERSSRAHPSEPDGARTGQIGHASETGAARGNHRPVQTILATMDAGTGRRQAGDESSAGSFVICTSDEPSTADGVDVAVERAPAVGRAVRAERVEGELQAVGRPRRMPGAERGDDPHARAGRRSATYRPCVPVNAIEEPSGDQAGSRRSEVTSPPGVATSVRAAPPAASIARMPAPSPVVDTNASVVAVGRPGRRARVHRRRHRRERRAVGVHRVEASGRVVRAAHERDRGAVGRPGGAVVVDAGSVARERRSSGCRRRARSAA